MPTPPRLSRRALGRLPAQVALVALTVLAVRGAVVAGTAFGWTRAFFRQVVEGTFPAVLEQSGQRVEAWLEAGRSEIELAAARGTLRGCTSPNADAATTPAECAAALEAALERSSLIDGLWLLDARGRVRAARGPGAGTAPPPDLAAPGLHALALPGARVVPVAVAALRDGKGWLVGAFRTDAVAAFLAGDSLPGVGRGYITDAEGRILFAGQGAGHPAARLPLAQIAAAGESRSVEWQAYDGPARIGLARPLSVLGWHLAIVADLDAGFAAVRPILYRVFLLDTAFMLLVVWLAWRLSRGWVRPLDELWRAARRVAEGDLESEVPERRGGEIGQLTRTFNAMVRNLREDQIEIEAAHRRLREQNQALQAANEVLAQLSITDGLTKLHNHRFFQDHLTRELKRVNRTGDPLSILLIDIDDFKSLNDRHGHATGDAVLARIAQVMNASVRESDLLARYGGEEFVVLAAADLEGSVTLAEKLRGAVTDTPILIDESLHLIHVTISVGVAAYKGDRKAFFRAADRALYTAKAGGKNRVVVDPGDG